MRQNTQTYEHAIGGLLQKRAEMMEEIIAARARLGSLSNDIEAIDRILERLGYETEPSVSPTKPHLVLFYRGELRQFLLGQIRERGALTTRAMAEHMIQLEGKDARDRRMMSDVIRRMGKALRQMRDAGLVTRSSQKIKGEYVWQIKLPAASSPSNPD